MPRPVDHRRRLCDLCAAMINDPLTAQELAEARRNDPWTTQRLIATIFITLGFAFTVLYLISP